MKEFFDCLKRFDLVTIFIIPTTNGFLQFFRYLFVGGISSVVDGGILYLFTRCGLFYMASTVVGFLAGLMTNYVLSKMLIFAMSKAKLDLLAEFSAYGLIGVIGLGLTMLIMYVLTEFLGFYYMFSKIVAMFLVLLWNYTARKFFLYRKN